MTRWLFLSILFLTAAGVVVYGYLGGFRKPDVAVISTTKPIFLLGQYYKGSVRDEAFGPLFREAQQLRASGTVRGELANIYYNDPSTTRDTVEAFIGLIVADTTSQKKPDAYRYRAFPAGQRVIQARTTTSYLLAPNKLYPAIEDVAKQQKLKLRQVYLEQFAEEGPSEVMAAIE
ncbi:hypothetical protein [Hymenobacter sp. GOD-10R]|uniref:hypothetical protein n=1 Tax=Hymenobacter sp. GOD-10R TaxID=3093922 RepID=UPI002D77EAC8|nr:hypothetical protein [Hymenobacter sp. GOD-10R]WRQ28472.1 hypothetical protein SD425_25735 [Hymenobacter sp. GOD-10R]